MEDLELENSLDEEKTTKSVNYYLETVIFTVLAVAFEIFIISIYSVWMGYPDFEEADHEFEFFYNLVRDISVMIFFGFAFLMTFLRRYCYTAIGMTFVMTAVVIQWSAINQAFFNAINDQWFYFSERFPFGLETLLEGIFCGATYLISFGAVLGKITPLQFLLMAILEPMFYWLNVYLCAYRLESFDIGGGFYIHIFGCYYGLAISFILTTKNDLKHPDNRPSYNSDIFAFAGTFFLFLMWPSFNAVLAPTGIERVRAVVNTYLSLTGAILATFVTSRVVSNGKFDAVHAQNSTLAGGVCMGIAAHLEIFPATALAFGFLCGFISVIGFKYLTPFMARFLHIHDTCGIHNLHGMPGIMGAFLSIFASLVISQRDLETPPEFAHGDWQPAIQFAALGVTLGVSIIGGLISGVILKSAYFARPIRKDDLFHDKEFWEIPYDYKI